MTHLPSDALPPPLYRSECFAEDLCEAAAPPGPDLGTQRRGDRRFPFPIAAYPAQPLSFELPTPKPACTRVVTAVLPRRLRRVLACAALAAATLPGTGMAHIVSYTYAGVVDNDDAGRGWATFSGQISFESSTPDQIADPGTADYKVSNAPNGNWPNGFNVTFNTGQSVSFNHYLDILVSNNLGGMDQWGAQAQDNQPE
jgi:hypothetical protein